MRLLFRRLALMTGRQLRHLIGAAIHRPTRSPENVDGQDGRSDVALLAVSTSQFSHDRVCQSTAIAFLTLRANATWFETVRIWWGCVPPGPQLAKSAGAIGQTYAAIAEKVLAGACEMGLQLSLRCWLLGHEDLVRTTTGRLYLECMECGRQTAGWRIGKSRVGGEARSNEGAHDAVHYARCASTPSNRAALKAA
jgi:hypothetical protein